MEPYDLLGKTLTVSEANDLIHSAVEELFCEMTIEGEISGFRPASSGHWYFTLKDRDAALDAAVFRSHQLSMLIPQNGDLVVARGSLSYYTKNGKLTFIVREMRKKGDGDLLQQIEKRKEYYRNLGYFDEDRKKPIPEEISVLGVVTSPTGAAIRDILNVTRRRAPSLDILIFPARVQGEGAAEEIAMRIRQADLFEACDLLIVGRGGGSIEDLAAFSEPAVIEAIHSSSIPIISAVGHEIDWPISDYAADRRAPTPSAAAEIATETIYRRRGRLSSALFAASSLMKGKTYDASARLSSAFHALSAFEKRIMGYRARIPSVEDLRHLLILRMRNAETRLGYAEEDAANAMEARLGSAARRLAELKAAASDAAGGRIRAYEALLSSLMLESERAGKEKARLAGFRLRAAIRECEALSPLQILRRGYSVTEGSGGRIIRHAGEVHEGDIITTRLMDGTVRSIVKEG